MRTNGIFRTINNFHDDVSIGKKNMLYSDPINYSTSFKSPEIHETCPPCVCTLAAMENRIAVMLEWLFML